MLCLDQLYNPQIEIIEICFKVLLWNNMIFFLPPITFVKSCPTLCNPMDCSLPGSSVHGIQPKDQTQVSRIAADSLPSMFHPSVEKIPWRRKWQPTPGFLSGEFHGQRSLAGYSPWGCKE